MSMKKICRLRFVVASVIALTSLAVAALICRPVAAENPSTPQSPSAANPGGKGGEATELTYQGPGGIVFRVTAAGLSEIRVGQRVLASGEWSVINMDPYFKQFKDGKHPEVGETIEKSIEVLSPRQARVRQVKKDVLCTTDYTFDGEDVLISARVQNNDPDAPINAVGFRGLRFCFQRPPGGMMSAFGPGAFDAYGLSVCHPGWFAKIGGTYVVDDEIGVGTTPWNTGWTRTVVLWPITDDWYHAYKNEREKMARKQLSYRMPTYVVVSPVPARGSRTFDLKLRISADRDWKHLLEPYREHFRKTFGPVRYKADYRWIGMTCLAPTGKPVTPANPYRYIDWARFDRPEGMRQFADGVVKSLKQSGGQGILIWAAGGDDVRGALYRPDFDVLPPEAEANWPIMAESFRKAGLKLGVATRPSQLAVRYDWKTDTIIDLNADDPGHREMILRRYQNMIDKGCTLFYLDSFGCALENVKLMRFLREKLGPNVLTFAEAPCDALMPYSGAFCNLDFRGGNPGGKPRYQLGPPPEEWEIYQWLVPGLQALDRVFGNKEGKIPQGFEPPGEFLYRHHVTPLLQDFGMNVETGKTQSRYLDASGGWKQ
jgi:hypothetical protein